MSEVSETHSTGYLCTAYDGGARTGGVEEEMSEIDVEVEVEVCVLALALRRYGAWWV